MPRPAEVARVPARNMTRNIASCSRSRCLKRRARKDLRQLSIARAILAPCQIGVQTSLPAANSPPAIRSGGPHYAGTCIHSIILCFPKHLVALTGYPH